MDKVGKAGKNEVKNRTNKKKKEIKGEKNKK